MKAPIHEFTVHLDRSAADRGVLRIFDPRGVRVTCRSGELWITEGHSPEDIVLAAGESRTLESRQLALVTPLQDNAEVTITAACGHAGVVSFARRRHLSGHARALRRERPRGPSGTWRQFVHGLAHPFALLRPVKIS